ncbi:MAG TPA: D-cysteine desulfhydrase family protein [Vicinamibacterales bacterium]|jgi:1-aminocyclopropane-1-carboxylate deaminase/D-cysteine desulfhydrase-like pyridoxal-dependent ACC family enzyme
MSRPDERALEALGSIPRLALAHYPTPIEELSRLRDAIGGGPNLLIKRDDALSFGFGGNKVRKLEMVVARAQADGADTLITTGGVQSNHARVTAAAAARLGMRCVIVANGTPPERLSGNALLDALFGAEIQYVASRAERAPTMAATAERLRLEGHRPVVIPLGASTPLGALGFVKAIGELVSQMPSPPDYIFHSTSSGGTQAGLVAGCALHAVATRVIGISADETVAGIQSTVHSIIEGMGEMLNIDGRALAAARPIEADDRFVGDGYGIPSQASREAQSLLARSQALVVDHTYTAKALAGMIGWIREGRIAAHETVLFWHTGGQVGIFAL